MDSGKEKQLTNSPRVDTVPMLTRDRRTIVYSQDTEDGAQLRVMSADGRGDRPLWKEPPDGCQEVSRPAQTPDGDFVVPCSPEKGQDDKTLLNLVAVDGTLIHRLDDQGPVGDVTVTPDGESVIYWRNTVNSQDGGSLYRVALDGESDPVQILEGDPGELADAVVSPDGSQLAFRRRVDNKRIIVTADFDGKKISDPRDRTSAGEVSQDPSWSPDGLRIAFKRGFTADADLRILDLESGDVEPVIANDGQETSPAWTAR